MRKRKRIDHQLRENAGATAIVVILGSGSANLRATIKHMKVLPSFTAILD